ncbi:MAG: 1-acylglycerol-3-phosphate O-acyltransferase [Oceanospirillaceae bacterium]|nr:1-acylglycerol-3-phosphate O-acyltransferase [Oceanospirillaceae bacterium]
MIALARFVLIFPLYVGICVFGCLFCLIRPFHRNNTRVVANMLSALAPLFGIKLISRVDADQPYAPKVIIGNHQSSFDLVTITVAVTDGTVSMGKKSIRWIPFFGQLYWLSGNILIDRNNKHRARSTIDQVVERITNDQLSLWMFPEGTRSRGKGLLPFKMGAFHTAIKAQVPIVPVVLSSTSHFSINKWSNGHAIAVQLDPIATDNYHSGNAKELAELCHRLMVEKIAELDAEVAELNKQ